VRGLDAEWKRLLRPTEYCLPNLTPFRANRNLGAWIVDAHKGDGKRYIVQSDELLSAFMELEAMLL